MITETKTPSSAPSQTRPTATWRPRWARRTSPASRRCWTATPGSPPTTTIRRNAGSSAPWPWCCPPPPRRCRRWCAPATGTASSSRPSPPAGGCARGPTYDNVVQMDLRRMNRILEIDEKNMYAVVEPYVCGGPAAGRGDEARAQHPHHRRRPELLPPGQRHLRMGRGPRRHLHELQPPQRAGGGVGPARRRSAAAGHAWAPAATGSAATAPAPPCAASCAAPPAPWAAWGSSPSAP